MIEYIFLFECLKKSLRILEIIQDPFLNKLFWAILNFWHKIASVSHFYNNSKIPFKNTFSKVAIFCYVIMSIFPLNLRVSLKGQGFLLGESFGNHGRCAMDLGDGVPLHLGLLLKHSIQFNICPGKNVPIFTINYVVHLLKYLESNILILERWELKTAEVKWRNANE